MPGTQVQTVVRFVYTITGQVREKLLARRRVGDLAGERLLPRQRPGNLTTKRLLLSLAPANNTNLVTHKL